MSHDERLRRALLLLRRMEEQLQGERASRHAPIAIIGTSCRLPGGVHDREALARALYEGAELVTRVPADR